jgi:hypothetical protein
MQKSDRLDALALVKSQRYTLDWRLGGPGSRSGRCIVPRRKASAPVVGRLALRPVTMLTEMPRPLKYQPVIAI